MRNLQPSVVLPQGSSTCKQGQPWRPAVKMKWVTDVKCFQRSAYPKTKTPGVFATILLACSRLYLLLAFIFSPKYRSESCTSSSDRWTHSGSKNNTWHQQKQGAPELHLPHAASILSAPHWLNQFILKTALEGYPYLQPGSWGPKVN